MSKLLLISVQSGVAGGVNGFVTCFLDVPLPCLGIMAAAVQPNSLGTLRKQFTKPSEQVAAPPGRLLNSWSLDLARKPLSLLRLILPKHPSRNPSNGFKNVNS